MRARNVVVVVALHCASTGGRSETIRSLLEASLRPQDRFVEGP